MLVTVLEEDGILSPTAIQQIGLPIALSNRDLLGISFTGTGKTLIFLLRALLIGYSEEAKLKISRGEGPFSLIICPSHELAIQIYEKLNFYIEKVDEKSSSLGHLQTMLCIGGIDSR